MSRASRALGFVSVPQHTITLVATFCHGSSCFKYVCKTSSIKNTSSYLETFQYIGRERCQVSRELGGCQNYGPFLGTLNIGCRIIIGIQKGTII